MKVYPVNAMEGLDELLSPERESYSQMYDLHNRYIDYQVDFREPIIQITGQWGEGAVADCFIIANTNAKIGTIKYLMDNTLVWQKDLVINEFINIFENINQYGMLQPVSFNNFILDLEGDDNISIGLLYIGETWNLPRFIVRPKRQLILRDESDRTFSGQVTGIPTEPLRTFAVEYIRINNQIRKFYDDYIDGVQTVIPHIIDPYPEAHDDFPPFFATVSSYGEMEKRDENGFFWNYNVTWREAR